MIKGAGAGNALQVSLGVVDLFNVGVVRDPLDCFLQRQDILVTGHHRYRAEPSALQMSAQKIIIFGQRDADVRGSLNAKFRLPANVSGIPMHKSWVLMKTMPAPAFSLRRLVPVGIQHALDVAERQWMLGE